MKGLLRRLLEVLLKVPGLLGLVIGLRLPEGVKKDSSRSLFPIPPMDPKSRESVLSWYSSVNIGTLDDSNSQDHTASTCLMG